MKLATKVGMPMLPVTHGKDFTRLQILLYTVLLLVVTLLLAVGGIVISFPIGVLLALGRRSSLPVVSIFSTI